jgi:hypothetical protein
MMATRIEIGRDGNGYYYGRVYDTTPGDFCGQNLYAGPARKTLERAQRDAKQWLARQAIATKAAPQD